MGERIALIKNSVARESSHRMFADEGKQEDEWSRKAKRKRSFYNKDGQDGQDQTLTG